MKYGIIAVVVWALLVCAWVTAVVVDGTQHAWGWLVADVLCSPVGVVRGFLIWLGVAG